MFTLHFHSLINEFSLQFLVEAYTFLYTYTKCTNTFAQNVYS